MEETNPASRSKLIVALFVLVMGVVILVPNVLPLVSYWSADRSSAVTARWVGSAVTSSARDTVAVPAFQFERRIGPVVQDCRVDLVQYRHAPNGKPLHESLQVIAGTRCDDLIVLDDPPNERIPLVALGLIVASLGAWLLILARRAKA
ncbi:MAG: hypothetical protein WCH83_09635 [Alphaproteobacteria bacterium]